MMTKPVEIHEDPKHERRSGFTYITALPKEAGFPLEMNYLEDERILLVKCQNGIYKISLQPGDKIYRIAVLLENEDPDGSGEDPGDQAKNDSDS